MFSKILYLLTGIVYAHCLSAITHEPSFPYISGDTFRACSNFVLDYEHQFSPQDVAAPGSIIFVKTDFLRYFFENYHPAIQARYILITHNSDIATPGPFGKYLEDSKLIHWFGINPTEKHHKFSPIPIGLANQCWPYGNVVHFNHMLAYRCGNMVLRNKLLYSSFTASIPHVYHLDERCYIRNLFKDKAWCTTIDEAHMRTPVDYLYDLLSHKFVLSPAGNGLDCHRHWEALLAGAIPIMKSSALDSLFEGLPVLIIDNWDTLTEAFLEEKYYEIWSKSYQIDKMYISWWLKVITYLAV